MCGGADVKSRAASTQEGHGFAGPCRPRYWRATHTGCTRLPTSLLERKQVPCCRALVRLVIQWLVWRVDVNLLVNSASSEKSALREILLCHRQASASTQASSRANRCPGIDVRGCKPSGTPLAAVHAKYLRAIECPILSIVVLAAVAAARS